MPNNQDAIRAVRAASNTAIAMRDAERVVACMMEDVIVSVAHGPVLKGREASRVAFAEQFADRAFAGYVREANDIVIHAPAAKSPAANVPAANVPLANVSSMRATERGRWTGRWRFGITERVMRGVYEAEWRHTELGWFIQSEVFTPAQTE